MATKQIWYSDHARRQIKRRGFTRQDVRWLLAQGVETDLGGNVFARRGYLGSREADVIYHENAERYLIITVEWLDE